MGKMIPMPKHTRQIVSRCVSPATDKTMRKTDTANGAPNYK